VEGGNVLAPNPKKRRVRIPSIVERGRRQKQTKKGNAVSTKDLPFWQNRQKLVIKQGGKKGKAVTTGNSHHFIDAQSPKRPLPLGWRNFFSAVLQKFLQPINAPQVYGT
jgi:hypothetical protein